MMIYLDNGATTKPHPEVLESFQKVSENYFANPSSIHELGGTVSDLQSEARKQIAQILSVEPEESRDIVDGDHEPILDEELFNLAQKQMKRRRNKEMSRSSYHHPFSSILKCGECGASYHAHNTVKRRNDKKAYTNYRCQNRKGKICNASDIAELKFTKLFFAYFKGLEFKEHTYTYAESVDDVERRRKIVVTVT